MSAADTFWQLPNTTPGSRMDRAKQAAKRAIARTAATVQRGNQGGRILGEVSGPTSPMPSMSERVRSRASGVPLSGGGGTWTSYSASNNGAIVPSPGGRIGQAFSQVDVQDITPVRVVDLTEGMELRPTVSPARIAPAPASRLDIEDPWEGAYFTGSSKDLKRITAPDSSAPRSNFRGDLRQKVIETEKKQRIAESRARRQERRGNGGFKAAAKELLPGIATDLMMEVVYAPSEMAWRKEMGQTESQAAGGALAGSIGSVGGAALGGLLGSRIARATGGKPGGFRSSMFGLAGSFGGQMIGQNLFAAAADRASGAQQTMMQAQLEQMQQMQQPRIANSTSGIDPVENPYLTIGSWY